MMGRQHCRTVYAAGLCILISVVCGGCHATSHVVYFRVVEVGMTRVPVEPTSTAPLPAPTAPLVRFTVLGHGTTQPERDGGETEAFHAHFRIDNWGIHAFQLDPARVCLYDDEGNKIACAEAFNGNRKMESVTVKPDSRELFTLAFTMPDKTPFARLGSLRMVWPYTYGDQRFAATAKFVKTEATPASDAEAWPKKSGSELSGPPLGSGSFGPVPPPPVTGYAPGTPYMNSPPMERK
jgi:hypothetical protein